MSHVPSLPFSGPAIASDGGWPGRSCIVCGTGRRSDAFHGARRLRRFREEGEARQVSAIATTSSGVGRALRLPITMGGGFSCRFVLSDLSDSTVASKIARSLASLRPCRLLLEGVQSARTRGGANFCRVSSIILASAIVFATLQGSGNAIADICLKNDAQGRPRASRAVAVCGVAGCWSGCDDAGRRSQSPCGSRSVLRSRRIADATQATAGSTSSLVANSRSSSSSSQSAAAPRRSRSPSSVMGYLRQPSSRGSTSSARNG